MKSKVAKVLITVATLIYGVVPVFADVNHTHIMHSDWPAHARFHTVWLILTNSSIALIALYQLWSKCNFVLSAILGLVVMFGFWIAVITKDLYAGALVDPGGVEVSIVGIDANVFAFALVTAMLVSGLVLGRLISGRHKNTG